MEGSEDAKKEEKLKILDKKNSIMVDPEYLGDGAMEINEIVGSYSS